MVPVASLALLLLVAAPSSPAAARQHQTTRQSLFPLRAAPTRRYLVDRRGEPFLIVGDSPQALIANLSQKRAAAYLADRQKAGFNAVSVDLLCRAQAGCRRNGATYDGVKPFVTPGDLSKPNPAYFARVDSMIRLAARHGIVVFLNPIDTNGWLGVLRKNGIAKDGAYGRFLGRRYAQFENVVWSNGGDFQSWRRKSDDAAVLAVARGIRAAGPHHLQTVELNHWQSASLDDARWRSVIGLDGAVTYYPTYAKVLSEYRRNRFMPVYMQQRYESDPKAARFPPGTPLVLRHQEYWSALSGAAGQFYGNHYTSRFAAGWRQHLDTSGSAQFGYLAHLLDGLPWFRLVPDVRHRLVTAGYGRYDATGSVGSSNYVAAASTPDRKLALAYLPAGGTVTVNTSRLTGHVRVRWFDPTNGRFRVGPGPSRPRTGIVRLTPPPTNALNDRDWLLVLTAG